LKRTKLMTSISPRLIGKIVVSQGFATEEQVRQCIKIQEQVRPDKPLGEILIDEGFINTAQLISVLDKQFSELQETDPHARQRRLDILFGQLVITKGVAPSRTVYDALREQENLAHNGIEKKLGEILQEKGVISLTRMQEILQAQEKSLLKCPHCGIQYNVANYRSDETVKCPECSYSLVLPKMVSSFKVQSTLEPRGSEATTLESETVQRKDAGGGDTLIGMTLGGCRIDALIGQGGMGRVYKGYQVKLGRAVAVKLLPEEQSRDDVYIKRLVREAKAVAACNHPNIIQVFDVGEENGRFFYIMEFVEGHTLTEITCQKGTWDPWDALDVILQAARALEEAGSNDIIHRDIKPDNIMITSSGLVKVADFGLAKSVMERSSLTRTGAVMGTPCYMSPEQCDGQESDSRSDIYSLGATLYYMLTGRPPFQGETPLVIMRLHLEKPLAPASSISKNVPRQIDAVLAKMMAKHRQERYQTPGELADAIESMLDKHKINKELGIMPTMDDEALAAETPLPADSHIAPAVESKPERRKLLPGKSVIITVVVLALVAGGLYIYGKAAESRRQVLKKFEPVTTLLDEVRALLEEGYLSQAREKYELVLKKIPEVLPKEVQKKFDEVQELFRAAEKNIKTQLLLVSRLEEESDYEEALGELKKAQKLDRKNTEILAKISSIENETRFTVLRRSGETYLKSDDLDGALEAFRAAAKVKPDDPYIREQISLLENKTAIEKAKAFIENRNWYEAGNLLRNVRKPNVRVKLLIRRVELEEMVEVPGGTFRMGHFSGPNDANIVHTVEIMTFLIDRYEVTNLQYQAFIDGGGYEYEDFWVNGGWDWVQTNNIKAPRDWKGVTPKTAEKPVTGTSWYEACAYAVWVGKRLPTEAEWEYAARGTRGKLWPWGNEYKKGHANTETEDNARVMPVGSYPSGKSENGCVDMTGNAWELCQDWYDELYYDVSPRKSPKGPTEGGFKVVRGGSWLEPGREVSLVTRKPCKPESRFNFVGFRCAKDR